MPFADFVFLLKIWKNTEYFKWKEKNYEALISNLGFFFFFFPSAFHTCIFLLNIFPTHFNASFPYLFSYTNSVHFQILFYLSFPSYSLPTYSIHHL